MSEQAATALVRLMSITVVCAINFGLLLWLTSGFQALEIVASIIVCVEMFIVAWIVLTAREHQR